MRSSRGPLEFLRPQRLAIGAIAAHFRPRQHDLKPEMRFDLLAQALQRLAEKFFHFAAAEADHVRVFLLAARLVKVLLAGLVHQIEFIHQATFLEQLQRPVNSHAIQFWIFLFRQLIKTLGVEMLTCLVDQIQQDLALPCEADTAIGKLVSG